MTYIPNYDLIGHAENEVLATYSDVVSVKEKAKSVHKFGANDNVGTSEETVMRRDGSETEETYVSGNDITHIISSDNSDNQEIKIEGHTISGSDFTFAVQTANLNGQTAVALTTPVARISRAFNDDSTAIAGTAYMYEGGSTTAGVPDDKSQIHCIVDPVGQQSLKCVTTFSSVDYAFLTSIGIGVSSGSPQDVEVLFRLKIRESGKIFRTRNEYTITDVAGEMQSLFIPYLIVPPNSDILMTAQSSKASTLVTASMNFYLAIITG